MKSFRQYVEERDSQPIIERLWIYECPHCHGEAYNGDPETGIHYRGSAKCNVCNESFSVRFMEPVSKEGPIVESWLGNVAQDAVDSLFAQDDPPTFFRKYLKRVYDDHNDETSWARLINGLKRYGKTKEAAALEFALKEGEVKMDIDHDPRPGFFPNELTFKFSPRRSIMNMWDTATYFEMYNKMWEKYGPPVRVVGQTSYWQQPKYDKDTYVTQQQQATKVQIPIYGFIMKTPYHEIAGGTWPDQRARDYQAQTSPESVRPAWKSPQDNQYGH